MEGGHATAIKLAISPVRLQVPAKRHLVHALPFALLPRRWPRFLLVVVLVLVVLVATRGRPALPWLAPPPRTSARPWPGTPPRLLVAVVVIVLSRVVRAAAFKQDGREDRFNRNERRL